MTTNSSSPLFNGILNAHLRLPATNTAPDCFYCKHPVDLNAEDYVRVDTLASVTQGKPKAYAHELCQAEAEAEHMEDLARDAYMEYQSEHPDPDYYDEFGEAL